MVTPTFDGTSLTTFGERMQIGRLDRAAAVSRLPGVNGVLVDLGSHGGRYMTVTGFLSATGATAALAHAALLDAFDVVSAVQAQDSEATFVDPAGRSHSYCVFVDYSQAGQVQTAAVGASFESRMAVSATILEPGPHA